MSTKGTTIKGQGIRCLTKDDLYKSKGSLPIYEILDLVDATTKQLFLDTYENFSEQYGYTTLEEFMYEDCEEIVLDINEPFGVSEYCCPINVLICKAMEDSFGISTEVFKDYCNNKHVILFEERLPWLYTTLEKSITEKNLGAFFMNIVRPISYVEDLEYQFYTLHDLE